MFGRPRARRMSVLRLRGLPREHLDAAQGPEPRLEHKLFCVGGVVSRSFHSACLAFQRPYPFVQPRRRAVQEAKASVTSAVEWLQANNRKLKNALAAEQERVKELEQEKSIRDQRIAELARSPAPRCAHARSFPFPAALALLAQPPRANKEAHGWYTSALNRRRTASAKAAGPAPAGSSRAAAARAPASATPRRPALRSRSRCLTPSPLRTARSPACAAARRRTPGPRSSRSARSRIRRESAALPFRPPALLSFSNKLCSPADQPATLAAPAASPCLVTIACPSRTLGACSPDSTFPAAVEHLSPHQGAPPPSGAAGTGRSPEVLKLQMELEKVHNLLQEERDRAQTLNTELAAMTTKCEEALWRQAEAELAAAQGGEGGGAEGGGAGIPALHSAAAERAMAAAAAEADALRAQCDHLREQLRLAEQQMRSPRAADGSSLPQQQQQPHWGPPEGADAEVIRDLEEKLNEALKSAETLREERDQAVEALKTALWELKAGAASVAAQKAAAQASERAAADLKAKELKLSMLEASLQGERAAKRTIISKAGQAVRELQRQLEEATSGRQVNWQVLQSLGGIFQRELDEVNAQEELDVLHKEIARLENQLGEQAAEMEALYHVVRSELEVELRAAAAHENAILAAQNEEMREAMERAGATENALRQALQAAGETKGAEAVLATVDEVERLQKNVNSLQVTLDAERRRASQMERWLREEIQALQEGDAAKANELRDRRKCVRGAVLALAFRRNCVGVNCEMQATVVS